MPNFDQSRPIPHSFQGHRRGTSTVINRHTITAHQLGTICDINTYSKRGGETVHRGQICVIDGIAVTLRLESSLHAS